MYVHKSSGNNLFFDAVKSSTERPGIKNPINGQRPLQDIERKNTPLSEETLIKELAPFIKSSDLEGALSVIKFREKELKELCIDPQDVEEAVIRAITYNEILNKIDFLVEHGRFKEAFEIVEVNSELIESMGTDPEDIKNSINDMKTFMELVQTIYDLISENRIEEARSLIKSNKKLLKKLDISSEYLQELFPQVNNLDY